jgi:hypothetical protein
MLQYRPDAVKKMQENLWDYGINPYFDPTALNDGTPTPEDQLAEDMIQLTILTRGCRDVGSHKKSPVICSRIPSRFSR